MDDKEVRGVFTLWDPNASKLVEFRGFKNRFLEPLEITYRWNDLIPFVEHMVKAIPGYDNMESKDSMLTSTLKIFSEKLGGADLFSWTIPDKESLLSTDLISVIIQLLMKKSFPSLSATYFKGNYYRVAGTPTSQDARPVEGSTESLYNDILGEVLLLTDTETFGKMSLLSKLNASKKVWYEKYIDTIPFQCLCRALREYRDRKADNLPLSDVDVKTRLNVIWRCIATGVIFYNQLIVYSGVTDTEALYRADLYDNVFKLLNEEIADLIIFEYFNNFKYDLVKVFLANLAFYGRIDLVARYIKMGILSHDILKDAQKNVLLANHLFGPIPDWFVPTYESMLPHPNYTPTYTSLFGMIKTGVFTRWSIPMIISAIDKGYVTTPLTAGSLNKLVGDPLFYRLSDGDKQKIYDHSDKDPIWRLLLFGEGKVPTGFAIPEKITSLIVLNRHNNTNLLYVRSEEDYKTYNTLSTKVSDEVYVSIDEESRIRPYVSQHGGGMFILDLMDPFVIKYIFSFLAKVDTEDIVLGTYWYQTTEITELLTYYSPEIPFEDYLKVLSVIIRESGRVNDDWDSVEGAQEKREMFFKYFPYILNRL